MKAIVTSVNNKVIKQTHALMGATASHLQVVAEHLTLLDKAEEEDAEVVKAELDSKKSAKTAANRVTKRTVVGRKKRMQA